MNTEIDEVAMTTLVAMSQAPEKFSATEIKNFYENIIAKLPCLVVWKDKDFKYVFCNEVTVVDFLKLRSPGEIIGKTDFDLSFNFEAAKSLRQVDEEIVKTGKPALNIETTFEMSDGKIVHLSTSRRPLFDSAGEVIGIIGVGVDITDQKEAERSRQQAERLQHENEIKMQQLIIEEKEKLITLAHKVAHDICSPLSALTMMVPFCDELQEGKRAVIKRAAESISDIANNLLNTYRNEDQSAISTTEQCQPVLISDAVIQLLSEKKVQYHNRTFTFETDIANDAQFAFAQLQPSPFRRCMSNLINNAVDALNNQSNDLITIKLTASAETITVAIQDNGKGMPSGVVEKIMRRTSFTEGKQRGHGLGLQQVWDTLDENQGAMTVLSDAGKGTTIQLTFPRITAPNWIAQTIPIASNSIVVILDDEESIHGAWDTRFLSYLKTHSHFQVNHFKHGQDALDFISRLTPSDKNRVVFLSDYELLRQNKNGLQIIVESQIKNATLVTSYYADASVRDKAIQSDIKILPKQMASVMPLDIVGAGSGSAANFLQRMFQKAGGRDSYFLSNAITFYKITKNHIFKRL